MNKEETIKEILKLGLKEYKPSKLERYDRAWQKTFGEELFINVNFWEFPERSDIEDSFEIEVYIGGDDDYAESIKIYALKDFKKAYQKALSYIK